MALVTLVVFLFLQNWRATLIPLIAVPVSLIGTFVDGELSSENDVPISDTGTAMSGMSVARQSAGRGRPPRDQRHRLQDRFSRSR